MKQRYQFLIKHLTKFSNPVNKALCLIFSVMSNNYKQIKEQSNHYYWSFYRYCKPLHNQIKNYNKKSDINKIPNSVAVAILLAVIALTTSLGVARWSWLLLDEQLDLRRELNELQMRQTQVETQYEFWLGQVEENLKELK